MKHLLFYIFVGAFIVLLGACGTQTNNGDEDSLQVFCADSIKNPVTSVVYKDSINGPMGVEARIENGQVYVTINADKMVDLFGFVPQMPDATSMVHNLDTTIVSLHISDIGQDYNPVLCMLRADGKVQILRIFDAISEEGMMFASFPLPGLENVVAFKEQGFEDYVGIVACDWNGDEKEVPYNPVPLRRYTYYESDKSHTLTLTGDWKIIYNLVTKKDGMPVKDEQFIGEYTSSFIGGEIDQQSINYIMHCQSDALAEDSSIKPYTDEGTFSSNLDVLGKKLIISVQKGKTIQLTANKEVPFNTSFPE